MRASLNAAEGERDRLRDAPGAAAPAPSTGQGEVDSLNSQIDVQKEATARALAQIENLNEQIRALRNQIAALQEALGTSDQKGKDAQVQIADLGQRLNVALAQRVQELSRYRSDFFGKLREILGNRPDIRVVGDRFVFQSEVFFDSGNADAPAGRHGRARQDRQRARSTCKSRSRRRSTGCFGSTAIPTPDSSAQPRNSSRTGSCRSARAISVVQYLISKGVPPQRLVAAGFGEFQPIDSGTTDEAFSHNRRIELKLTER